MEKEMGEGDKTLGHEEGPWTRQASFCKQLPTQLT